ncbi:MAG: single-stranded-DNA-specific exonuclease RecJ [candidate division Zixibacteria bacterium RBG_16_43_9]|nr:MAG: single-stranded-DNA-specific exonuclease RecJ [candidate division Zixibacteria bacterium RBG_16_43_9]
MELKWEFPQKLDENKCKELSSELGLPPVIGKILINRGYSEPEEARNFLNPSLSDLSDPFMLKDMERGVDRVISALTDKEKIMIFGDYDVDGITSASLMYLVLTKLGAQVSYYLPNRLVEGYGLSEEGILEAERRGAKLIISVDCGINAVKEVDFAQKKGIDCIITDHHEPAEVLPDAWAIINPKQEGETYKGKELSGVGVAFKLAQALYRKLGQDEKELEDHLDLVALGTAADIVPLLGENRILTRYGLLQVAKTSKPGLKSLIFISGLMGREIGTGQVVFILAPRINAVGRLGDAERAIKLLTTRDEKLASEISRVLDEENRKRKNIDEGTLEQALELIQEEVNLKNDKAIILASAGWHQGVIGIVASRVAERFYRPTVMISIDGEEGKGSARSIPGFHLFEALKECEDCLLKYGGHKYAAGLSISSKKIESFKEKFKLVSARIIKDEDLIPRLTVDAELELEEIQDGLISALELFAPFGPGNLKPVFVTRGLELADDAYVVGKNHLRLRVKKNGIIMDAIGFNLGDFAKPLAMRGTKIDLAYVLELNVWNGNSKIQMRLKDLQMR